MGPEGAVYVLTDDGKLLKLTPKYLQRRISEGQETEC
jgi:hypothetical protein